MEKSCKKCNIIKPLNDFHTHNGMKDKHLNTCKICHNTQKNEIYHRIFKNDDNQKRKKKDQYLQRKFNITQEDFNNIFNQQNGCCDICKLHQTNFKKAFCVDHDHKTGKIRGLLCDNCNLMIGNSHDTPEILSNGIEYLNKHNKLKLIK